MLLVIRVGGLTDGGGAGQGHRLQVADRPRNVVLALDCERTEDEGLPRVDVRCDQRQRTGHRVPVDDRIGDGEDLDEVNNLAEPFPLVGYALVRGRGSVGLDVVGPGA